MEVSVKTLFLTNVSVLFLSAGACYYFWRLHRDNVGLLWWSLATALAGCAILIFRLFGPGLSIAGLTATLFVGACLMAWESTRRFNGRPAAKARMAVLLLAFVAILGSALVLGADMQQRVGLLSAAIAICAALSAREVARGGRAEPLHSRLPMALVLAVMAALLATRAVVSLLHSPGSSVASFYVAMGDFIPLANAIGIVCLNIGFLMMANERLSDRYLKRALTDELTGLPNRRCFLEQGERLSRRARKNRTNACVLMMDLDRFSRVNERFGHGGGDLALAAFAQLLREQVPPIHVVARYGGEEFCALLAGMDAAEGTRTAERLRQTVAAQPIDMGGQTLKLTVSIGVAALHEGNLAGALRSADEALYRAKARGRNQVITAPDRLPSSRSVERPVFGLALG